MGKLLLIIFSCIVLAGCGTVGEVYRYEDNTKIKECELRLNKTGALSYERNGVKVQMDSRSPTMWERFITPVLQGASNSAKENVNVN